jgi:hypothetical protein
MLIHDTQYIYCTQISIRITMMWTRLKKQRWVLLSLVKPVNYLNLLKLRLYNVFGIYRRQYSNCEDVKYAFPRLP